MNRTTRIPALIAFLLMTVLPANGQSITPSARGYASVNGIKMYYEVYGEGMPVILLHGSFYTIELNWSHLIPRLSTERKVIAVEMQGHGHSPYSDRRMSLAALASDVEKLMDYLKIGQADVVGYSMGGAVAYQFAVQSPKRLRKLVVISAAHKTGGFLPIGQGAFDDFQPELFDNTPLHSAYTATAPDSTKWRAFINQMVIYAKEPYDIGDSLIARIASPVLIIAGDNDGLDKVELMKTYQLLGGNVFADMEPMPKSQLAILPAQGHVSVVMQTEPILWYLREFLQ